MTKTIKSKHSGHTFFIAPAVEGDGHPAEANLYDKRYTVRNFDKDGMIMLFVASGYNGGTPSNRKEVCVWYSNGAMWNSFGKNIEEAIAGAQHDGWKDATQK